VFMFEIRMINMSSECEYDWYWQISTCLTEYEVCDSFASLTWQQTSYSGSAGWYFRMFIRGRHGCDRMVVGLATTSAMSSNPVMWLKLSVTYGRLVVFPGTPVSSTIKTGRHDQTEILLKVALNTISPILSNSDRIQQLMTEFVLHLH
jgi:hypothetical protein